MSEMDSQPAARAVQRFRQRFGAVPELIGRAPGRVNLIGEHVDYNDGFVLPMAIDRHTVIAFRARQDQQVNVWAADLEKGDSFDLQALPERGAGWAAYVHGVAWALQQSGAALRGWDGVIAGDVPRGAGLSSSAALELAVARVFAHTSGLAWDASQMALIGQRAENEWVGVNCGIMDQMISAAGIAGQALLIDCRDLTLQNVPLPDNCSVIVMDTAKRRGLVDSSYNERRQQCEQAARVLGVRSLRDASMHQLLTAGLQPLIEQRARHVITEIERTLQAADAMRAGDATRMGVLMNASHASLRDDYAVSCTELDVISALAQSQPGCYGARMTGGGFGGCAVALVDSTATEEFSRSVAQAYEAQTGLHPRLYVCQAAQGASLEVV